ncbi:hypothetical protein H5410_046708 [Solanum commersonii]|uniref:Uncharacterized protein n=1 Tax=Solanum commersonii TaxID=4109 RepID=A0A9J5XF26_SOLCO|nr:hypothetical protein H5410_046708 [Solanum commersonii]
MKDCTQTLRNGDHNLKWSNCPRVSAEDNLALMDSFGSQEIFESIKACAGDKALGLDGYFMEFFKQCWETIKVDLVATMQNFHEKVALVFPRQQLHSPPMAAMATGWPPPAIQPAPSPKPPHTLPMSIPII